MKQLAVVLAAVLSLTLVAPALAQPFADVPTDHWAYDAIAELAAKGLIEGYPDGSFRGDRAMTRYEMAMVVARLLARIEAIKIPPLPGDLVRTPALTAANAANAAALRAVDTRLTAKLATIQRLVAEFRAELAALGVRVTAVEEELAALKARVDNTKITGDARLRYNLFPSVGPSGGTQKHTDARIRTRLTFTGAVASNVTAVVRLLAANNAACERNVGSPDWQPGPCSSYDTRLGHNYNFGVVSFDLAYVDIARTYGAALWRAGRQFYTLAGMGPYGVGLLYDPANSVAAGSYHANMSTLAGFSINNLPLSALTTGLSDGLRSDWVVGPINLTLAVFRDQAVNFAPGAGSGTKIRDNRVVRATTGAFIPGWTLGGSYFQEWVHPASLPGTSGGTGWGGDISGTLIPGLRLYAEYTSWTTTVAVAAPKTKAWRAGGNANLAALFGFTAWNPNVDFEYHDYGPVDGGCTAFSFAATPAAAGPFAVCYPINTYATTITGQVYAFNMKGWLARLNLTFSPTWSGSVLYESGTTYWPTTDNAYSEWWIRVAHTLAPRTTMTFNYYLLRGPTLTPAAGPSTAYTNQEFSKFYRIELLYSW